MRAIHSAAHSQKQRLMLIRNVAGQLSHYYPRNFMIPENRRVKAHCSARGVPSCVQDTHGDLILITGKASCIVAMSYVIFSATLIYISVNVRSAIFMV